MAEVRLVHVNKTYAGSKDQAAATAADNVCLDIGDQEFVTLTGPAECGKTTLLRIIMGLEEPDSGEIWVGKKRTDGADRNPVSTGMVFQSGSLYPHMTIYRNLAFPLKKLRLSREETEQRVNEAARLLGVKDLLLLKPKALNREQNQRVAIARAIVSMPDVVVMDEPLAMLNDQERSRLRADLISLREQRKLTVIYAAYDLAEAMALGDRVVFMQNGRIEDVKTPEELLKELQSDRPA